MTDFTPGVLGVTRSTWRDETHLRGLLLRLMTLHPDATREELEQMYLDRVRRSPDLIDEAARRAFDNDLARTQRHARTPTRRRTRSPSLVQVTGVDVAAATQRLQTVVLLDLMQPNGKKLRDCTGQECRQAGGWLIQVANRVGDLGVVGATLTEADVAGIFASSIGSR